MTKTLTIAKRELFSFFVSPVAYFVITSFLLLSAYFFFTMLGYFNLMLARYSSMPYGMGSVNLPNLNQWVVEGFFQTLILVLVFLTPFLTMRVIAEDRKRGTFELLMTSPISIASIVYGKFLAVAAVVGIMIMLAFSFPLLLCVFGNPEVRPIFSGLLGTLLCAITFVSLSMAVSCFTENQIVAGITGVVLLLILYVIHSPVESMTGPIADLLKYISPNMQIQDMIKGVITTKALIYFASMTLLGLFISQRVLDSHRWR